jgi:ABC-type lipoprotein export system ATPase subunit
VLLKLENIGKIYDSNGILTIGIRNVNLEFDFNEFVLIEGESGSGKSTLLNVVGANDTYEEGELYFNGSETSHYSANDWERYREQNISTVFQDFNIIENLTVSENIQLALFRIDDIKERKRIAKELIDKVGLTKQASQRCSKLSGGEKQRAVIARALAKDSPIILADEPTGNLDVKSSTEIAKLLKEVSSGKLVIVVTHNADFFKQYATRRVRMYDGKVSEDKLIEKPAEAAVKRENNSAHADKKQELKNTVWLGLLNYKSRPRFTVMMSFALAVCAIALFIVLNVFGETLIKPLKTTLDGVGIEGKVILSNAGALITEDELNGISESLGAGYSLWDRELSEFFVTIPESGDMLKAYTVTCLYAPYRYALEGAEAVLVMPVSAARDEQAIKDTFLRAGVGITSIRTEKTLSADGVYLYLGYDALANNGKKIQSIYNKMKIDGYETTVYTFRINDGLGSGEINLVNSDFWNVRNKTVVLSAKSNMLYTVIDDSGIEENAGGLIVEMNAADYDSVFSECAGSANQACLYFSSDKAAKAAIEGLPEGYMGMLSASKIYVQGAGEIFTANILYYLALILVGICLAVLISVIFMRSVKIYQTDFTVYRTLGISRRISSRSLNIQMALIFLPTLVLMPLVSLIAAVMPGSTMAFIGIGEYLFIEIMMLLIVEFVAFGFNKSIKGQSVRTGLRRGLK